MQKIENVKLRMLLFYLMRIGKYVFILSFYLLFFQNLIYLITMQISPLIFELRFGLTDESFRMFWGGLLYLLGGFCLFGKDFIIRFDIKSFFKDNKIIYVLLFLILWIVLSVPFSKNIELALFGAGARREGIFAYLSYALIFCGFFLLKKKHRDNLINIFVFVSVAVAICTLINSKTQSFVAIEYYSGGFSGVFRNQNHYAYYLTMAIITSYCLFICAKSKWLKIAYIIASEINLVALFYTNTLGGMFGVVFGIGGIIIAFWVSRKFKLEYVIIIACFVISVCCFIKLPIFDKLYNLFINMFSFSKLPPELQGTFGSNRIQLWRESLKLIEQNPIFGIGIDNYSHGVFPDLILSPHNEFIQLALYCGIPALLAYLVFIGYSYVKAIIKNKELNDLQLIGVCVVFAYSVSAFFGNTMVYTTPYFAFFLASMQFLKIKKHSKHYLEDNT